LSNQDQTQQYHTGYLNRSIQQGDVIVVDVTVTHNDYYGDFTRTFMPW
jgi:hypothetical protein